MFPARVVEDRSQLFGARYRMQRHNMGAIVNDGCYGRSDDSAVNCMLKSCRKDFVPRVMQTIQSTRKQRVSADVAAVWSLAGKELLPQDELLLNYGGKSFWRKETEHCVICFGRSQAEDNPLVLCEGSSVDASGRESLCHVARHRLCFSSPPSTSELSVHSGVSFHCPDHLALLAGLSTAATTTPQHRASAATPKPRRAVCLEPPYTPPPPPAAASAVALQSARHSTDAPAPSSAVVSRRFNPEPKATPPPASHPIAVQAASPDDKSCIDLTAMPSPAAGAAAVRPVAQRSILFDPHTPSSLKSDSASRFYPASSSPCRQPRSPQHVAMQAHSDDDGRSRRRGRTLMYGRAARQVDESDYEWDSDSNAGSDALTSNSDSDEDGSQPDLHQALGRRSSATKSKSVCASVQETMSQLSSASFANQKNRVRLRIRTSEHAKLLPQYVLHAADLTDAQWAECERALKEHAAKGRVAKAKPWFITEDAAKPFQPARKPRKPSAAAAAASAPPPLSRSSSVRSGPVAMEIDDDEEDAVEGAAASVSTSRERATTNRWRDRERIAHDWGEYRSCCGQPEHWMAELPKIGMADQGHSYSALSVTHMFAARVKHLADFRDRSSFTREVANQLVAAIPRWLGLDICCSCYRAVLGISRNQCFAQRKLKVNDTRDAVPELTAGGKLIKKRLAPKTSRAMQVMKAYCLQYAQKPPNPKNADPEARRYILPQKIMSEVVLALNRFDNQRRQGPALPPLDSSIIYHAKTALEERDKFFISLGTGNSLCRCTTCDALDNKMDVEGVTEKQVMELKAQKEMHLKQMEIQRDYFEDKKNHAMLNPTDVWCITFDGMDQAKTQLPSRARFSKELEAEVRLKLHWLGAFCFGGPEPVLGLMNTPELRKDASLSIVTLERILDLQWLLLEKQHRGHARIAESRSQAAASQAASQAAADELQADGMDVAAGPADCDASTLASSGPLYSGPGMSWPRTLHLTFDNAAGENKNQWMFRFLGLLVHHGMFEYITASMLLVGHTHDIVDQMFSVWSRMLRLHNAETYSKMRALFRERYHSRIDGLVELMRGKQATIDALSLEERAAYDGEVREAGGDWNKEQADILQEFSSFVKKHNLCPFIERQTTTVDVQAWLTSAVEGPLPGLAGLKYAYNFAIAKDKHTDDIYLYNKQFANSTGIKDSALHEWVGDKGLPAGEFTTRALLYKSTDPGLQKDPYRMPPLGIDVAPLEKTVRKFAEHAAMKPVEQLEFQAMLDDFTRGQEKQLRDCEDCCKAAGTYSAFGVVSDPVKALEAEKQKAKEKRASRKAAWDAMLKHLGDSKFALQHDSTMTHAGWWTKWLTRIEEHIKPAFVERCVIMNPVFLSTPFHPAATTLCSGVGEPPVHSAPEGDKRGDIQCLTQQGIPQVGQLAVVRTMNGREPFYIAKITAVLPSSRFLAKQARAAEAMLAEAAADSNLQPVAAAAAAVAAAPPRELESQAKRLKDIEIQAQYYDVSPETFGLLHLSQETEHKKANDAWWAELFEKHVTPATIDSKTEAQQVAAMELAMEQRRAAPARPGWLINLYENSKFLIEQRPDSVGIAGSTLVLWGSELSMFKKAGWHRAPSQKRYDLWQLRADAFRRVFADLTECKKTARSHPPAATAAAAAAAASAGNSKRRGGSDDESDFEEAKQERRQISGKAAAAAAGSARPSLARAARAAAVSYAIDEEDEEEEEEQGEEVVEEPEQEEVERRKEQLMEADSDSDDSQAPLNTFLPPEPKPSKKTKTPSSPVHQQQQKKKQKPSAQRKAITAPNKGERARTK